MSVYSFLSLLPEKDRAKALERAMKTDGLTVLGLSLEALVLIANQVFNGQNSGNILRGAMVGTCVLALIVGMLALWYMGTVYFVIGGIAAGITGILVIFGMMLWGALR